MNIFVLVWSREGQMLSLAEKIILPLLIVYMFLLIILGNVAVSRLWNSNRTKLYDTQFDSQTDLQANLLSNLHKTIVNHDQNNYHNKS